MTSTASLPPRDQASRLRTMVSGAPSPNVSVVHWSDRSAAQRTVTVNLAPRPPRRDVSIPVVAITSGKGGVGKTNLSVNLSVALSNRGCRVSLLDADLGLANADLLCGLNPTNRLDVAADPARSQATRRSLDQIAMKAPGGFRLVPGSVGVARMANLSAGQRETILDGLADLERESDVILIDTGAGLNDSVTSFVMESDLTAVIATPEPTSIADAYALIKCVVQSGRPPIFALVVNQARDQDEALHVHARIASTCKRFLGLTLPLVGIIRRDEAVSEAVRDRIPFAIGTPRAKASRDVAEMAGRLMRTLEFGPKEQRQDRRGLFGWLSGR